MLGANGNEAGWRVGRMVVLRRNRHPAILWEIKFTGAGRHLMELDLKRESPKNLSSSTSFSYLHRLWAHSLNVLCLHHEAIFRIWGIVLSYNMVAALLNRDLLNNTGHLQGKKRTVRSQVEDQSSKNWKNSKDFPYSKGHALCNKVPPKAEELRLQARYSMEN